MNVEICSDDERSFTPGPDEPVLISSGGMFAGSQHFTVAGGTFNNTTNHYIAASVAPSDFRMIPMGDIDLQRELMVNKESGVIESRREHNCVQRVYSAKVDGRKSDLTVAVYQGHGAEEAWRQDSEMYMSVRHPNIIQIWAGASYGNIHATVFHGDLVSLKAFLARQSPITTVYLYGCYSQKWRQVKHYFKSLRQRNLYYSECTMWIRSSTGQLSVDFVPSDTEVILYPGGLISDESSLRQTATPLGAPITEVFAVESLTLKQYHRICALYLTQYRDGSISTSTTVNIGAVISWPSQHRYEERVEIALSAKVDVDYRGWRGGKTPENGWSRCKADNVFNTEITLLVSSYNAKGWFSQADHVLSRLQITSNLEDYFLIENTCFTIAIGNAREDPPPGYLFFCLPEEFRTGATLFRWPNCPAYWSVDPSGVERLSIEEATHLGFPPFQLITTVDGRSWDASVYAGLRRPLYRLSRDLDSPSAQVNELSEYDEDLFAGSTTEDDEILSNDGDAHEADGERPFCDSHLEESGAEDNDGRVDRRLEPYPQLQDGVQDAPEVHQEPVDRNSSSTEQETHTDPHGRATGGGFIHRIIGALRHSLVIEAESIDTDPISPFLA